MGQYPVTWRWYPDRYRRRRLSVAYCHESGNPWATGGMWLYLFGMLSSYISSTWYHASKPSPHREVLRKFDHASIYLHIAGSYSPIMLIALREADYWGWGILSFVWLCALAGIILCFVT